MINLSQEQPGVIELLNKHVRGEPDFFDVMVARRLHAKYQRHLPKKYRPKCGAKTRKGAPCKAPVVWDKEKNQPVNGRCKLHGGLSTGPKTEEGKKRALANLKQYRGGVT